MAPQRHGEARTTGFNRVRTITNLAVAGAVTGTAAMGVFVAHEYGGHTTTPTPTSTGASGSSGSFGSPANETPQPSDGEGEGAQPSQSPDQQNQFTQPSSNYAPQPSQGPPQGTSGGS